MAIQNRPDEKIFASNAGSQEVSAFPNIEKGWGFTFKETGGIPTMEHFNALFKRIDEHFNYMLQRGLPEWSATLDYPVGAYVQYDNKTYRAKKASKNQRPDVVDSTYWVRWSIDYKEVSDFIEEAGKKGVPIGAIVSFPKGMNPRGYLRAIGGTFNQETYPDLYIANGNSNILPNLNRSDVGMTAYFPFDDIPDGWIAFDSIRSTVTQQSYPELYQYLVAKYGSISQVPLADDRFIRNASNRLKVGQTQESSFEHHHGIGRIIANNDAGLIIGEWQDQNHRSIIVHGQDAYVDMRNVNGDTESGGSRPLRTAKENPQSEVRPKSIIFKLCIKAKNTFEDVVFWIKAFGEVQNAGALDASRLAQELQEKAGINHTHRASDIVDLDSAIASAFTREKRGDSEIRKLPDGTMVQIARVRISDNKVNTKQYFTWPVAFTEKPRVFPVIVSDDGNLDDATVIVGIVDRDSTNTRCFFITRETGAVLQPGLSIEFLAFGRWK
ncbi:Phage Tail Collar Domain [Pasteurella multocida]|nr:Phage Tail Collar Domain [Pasteurella multocida]